MGRPPKDKIVKKCLFCNKEFETKKNSKKFCSYKCVGGYYSEKNRLRILGDKNPAKRPEVREKIRQSKLKHFKRKCKYCLKEFPSRQSSKKVFCCSSCRWKYHRKERAFAWKGGRLVDSHGYVWLIVDDHPFASVKCKTKYVLEHRLIIEKYLGRYLHPAEKIHHKNKDRLDNRIENLQIMTNSEHTKLHALQRKRGKELKTYGDEKT